MNTDLRFDARDEVTTAPARACGGEPSIWEAKLLRGVILGVLSASELTGMFEIKHDGTNMFDNKKHLLIGLFKNIFFNF